MLGAKKEILCARSEIISNVDTFMAKEGMSSKRRSTYLEFSSRILDTNKTFQLLDKDYRYMHVFELHCGINWRDIWRLVWIDDPAIKENMFKKMALIDLMSTSDPEFCDLEYRSMRDVDRISKLIIRYHQEIVLPFFEKWSDYHKVRRLSP